MDLKGKVTIITGGAVRLGKAMALALAAEGARVVVHYGSSASAAEETAAEIKSMGGEVLTLQADLRESGAWLTIIEQAYEHFGQIDALINSAAIFQTGDIQSTTEDSWDKHFDINLKAPFFLSQTFAKHLGMNRRGHIVNIADWRATRTGADHIAYTLTKAAIVALTRNLAVSLAPDIQVNAIAPGAILPPPGRGQGYLEQLAQNIPARKVGSPDDIVHALLYLLKSDFVTGELMLVTGGEQL